jgi:hypothetical protein
LERFADALSTEHRQVIEALCPCRTETLGAVCYPCEDCGHPHGVPAACGHRHCPQCQHCKSRLWLERQLERPLPGPHFMLTFTVPDALRAFLSRHPRWGYSTLSAASAQAIKARVRDPRCVGGDAAGFFGVLHPWGRQLQYHPHIHYVVPGGALSSEDGAWHASSPRFFLPVKALSKRVRAKFRDRLHRAGLLADIPAAVWAQDWNIHCQAVPNAQASIEYLAPDVFKGAITDHRILKVEDGQVCFSYRKPGSARRRTLTLDALEFMRRFLQRVLPTGFMKVRYDGFLSPTARVSLEEVKAKVELAHGFTATVPEVELPPWPPPACPVCGGHVRFHKSWRAYPRPQRLRGEPPGSPPLPPTG